MLAEGQRSGPYTFDVRHGQLSSPGRHLIENGAPAKDISPIESVNIWPEKVSPVAVGIGEAQPSGAQATSGISSVQDQIAAER